MIDLKQGDCLQLMLEIPDNSIDMVCCDPPYGTTACKWDSVIDIEKMWASITRIVNGNGAIALMASQPFTTILINSNLKHFKYCWVWEKNLLTNHLHAKRQPMRKTEDIIIFHQGASYYYPIKTTGHKPTQSAKGTSEGVIWGGVNKRDYKGGDTDRYPTNIIKCDAPSKVTRIHPSQKPVGLMEYLIKTYTNPDETVLDFAMGSGTTGVACKKLGRKFIGIELDENYFQSAKKRIKNTEKLTGFNDS